MRRTSRLVTVGLIATLFAASGAAPPTLANPRDRHHRIHQGFQNGSGQPRPGDNAADAARNGDQARGLYAGAGGIYSPYYEVPGAPVYHLGAQLLGGDFGKSYEDYYRHYYYYKYAYCPIGTGYVIYLRRCVGIGDLFQ